MYWGDEYQETAYVIHQRRGIVMNSQLVSKGNETKSAGMDANPIIDFRVIAGAPLRSRLVFNLNCYCF